MLSRQVRENLVLSVVVECLNAYRENRRDPVISKARVVQMLRSLDDEARARAADVLSRFVRDVSENESRPALLITAEFLFDASVKPFLEELWPKERSLANPMVAKALADLPASSRGRFAEAVTSIDRYLMPFDCYSLFDFGLRDTDDSANIMNAVIGDSSAARALLCLLDRSINHADRSVFPYELGKALSHIKIIDPSLEDNPRFLRLSMLINRQ